MGQTRCEKGQPFRRKGERGELETSKYPQEKTKVIPEVVASERGRALKPLMFRQVRGRRVHKETHGDQRVERSGKGRQRWHRYTAGW